MSDERIIVIGADSLIGNALAETLKRSGRTVLETTRRRELLSENRIFLDLEQDIFSVRFPSNISVAFLCAACDSLEYCHKEPLKTAKINVEAMVRLAEKLIKAGVFVVFFSTNLVYDGAVPCVKVDAPVSAQTEHGRQKAEAERQMLPLGNLMAVLRLTKIFGPETQLLQEWILALKSKKKIQPFRDKVISPLLLSTAVQVSCLMIEKRLSGIVQISSDQDVTYAQIAYRLAHRMRVRQDLVQPVLASESGLFIEHLPRNTTFDTTRLVKELGIRTPKVWSVIDTVIDQNLDIFKRK